MRLLTRADLDGLTCAVLLSIVESIDEVVFVEPHKMQAGGIQVGPEDIIANLPFHPACGMWFDHHISNALPPERSFRGAFGIDPSAARTIYKHYQDPRFEPFMELLEATDKVDAAILSMDDVRHPEGFVLLSLSLDPRSNLEDSDQYYHLLLELLKTAPVDVILERPEVKSRCSRILNEQTRFEQVLLERSRAEKNVVVTDLRGIDPLPVGSRFLVYTLFPECNASIKIYPSRESRGDVGISLGHSIFNRTQTVNVGKVCARYGGGGHAGAGSLVVPADQVDKVVREVLAVLQDHP